MPFPEQNTPWPPPSQADRYDRMAERSVWYAGDPDDLKAFYRGRVPQASGSWTHEGTRRWGRKPVKEVAASKFWGLESEGPLDDKVHLPVAESISTASAEALFADAPQFVIDGPTFTNPEGKVVPTDETERTQARLDALVDQAGVMATVMAAAETASALGCVALRIGWDEGAAPYPVLTRVDGDCYLPFYRWGQLTGVLFWQVVKATQSEVWRHLELHEDGMIQHALYVGNGTNLGRLVPLTDHPATASLPVDEFGATYNRRGVTTAVSVPNMLPDPLDRTAQVGRSDYSPAAISLFSAIDQSATSLMRDVEDGQSRLLVADYMLKNAGFGKGATFDAQGRLFTALKRAPGETAEPPIDQVQFDIRYQEHLAIIDDLTRRAWEAAGFTPDADKGEGGGDMTATEFSGRMKRTLATRDKKVLYWKPMLERILTAMLVIDAERFGSGVTPMPVKVLFPDAVQETPKSLADTAVAQKASDATSRYTRVKTLHPDWDEPDILAELARIDDEAPEPIDPGTFGLPMPGVPEAPEPTDPEADEAE